MSETDINLPLLGAPIISRNVQAENIIASEPPKILASSILVEFFVLIFADLSSVVSLICPD